MASRDTGPSLPSPYDPGAGGLPSRPTAGGPPPTPALGGGKPPWAAPPDALSLLRALARHWVKALLLGLFLGSVAAGLTWLLYPKPRYTATAYIEVQTDTPTTLPGSMPLGSDTPFELFIQSEMQRLKLNRVLRRAADNLDQGTLASKQGALEADSRDEGTAAVAPDAGKDEDAAGAEVAQAPTAAVGAQAAPGSDTSEPTDERPDYGKFWGEMDAVEWLQANLQVSPSGNFILVRLQSEIPFGLDDIVNEVVAAYMSEFRDERLLEMGRLTKLRELGEQFEVKLQSFRNELQALTKKGLDPNTPAVHALARQLGMERQAELLSQYTKVTTDLKRAENDLAGLEEMRNGSTEIVISDAEVDRYFEAQPAVRDLKMEIEQLTQEIDSVRYTSRKGNDAALVKFQQQRKAAQDRLDRMAREWRPQIIDQLRAQAASGDEGLSNARQIARLQRDAKFLRELKDELGKQLTEIAEHNKAQTDSAAEMFDIQNKFKYADRAAERIRARLAEMEVEIAAPDRVKVVNPAPSPTVRSNLKERLMVTGMAGGGMFGATLLMVALLEFRTRRVKAPDEVVRSLGMSVVGTIPSLPDPKTRRPGNATQLADSRWQQAFMESVDATRMLLLHMSRSENLRAVMITSANGGEGKTSLACYLGGSLARAVHRTLIVDCDLRRPAVHQVFDTPREPGLSDLLRGEAEIQDIVRPTPIDGLFVIPAGRLDGRAMLSLSKGELGPILDWLKDQYDFVIVDAPPVLAVADALQLSQHVDAVLFSILRDVSRMPEVYEARERLATMNVRVLGAVVSGTPLAGLGYDRRYAYGEKVST